VFVNQTYLFGQIFREYLMKLRTLIVIAGASAALTACMPQSPRPMPVAAAPVQATGVEGSWSDPNGIISTFQAGTFTTRTTDTNQMLASGTYVSTSPTLVEINMTSLVRKTQSKVNCALVTQSQLNCTSDAGSQFSLTRHM
jgi:phosphoribosylcarboxyaminoimidazole (NCAIR) mutase